MIYDNCWWRGVGRVAATLYQNSVVSQRIWNLGKIYFPEASSCGSWVLLDVFKLQTVRFWLPRARMMYRMCQCGCVGVISSLLILTVSTSSCPSLTSPMSSSVYRTIYTGKHLPTDFIEPQNKLSVVVVSLLCVTVNILKPSGPLCEELFARRVSQ